MEQQSPTVLVIEDAPDMQLLLKAGLEQHGFTVHVAGEGGEGLALLPEVQPEVVLLDLGLPDMDGLDVCRRIRAAHAETMIMMLTARDDDVDTIVGLEVGADDYVVKPCPPRVLVARLRALLRRGATTSTPSVHDLGPLVIDIDGREVTVNGKPVELTRIEFDLLALLSVNPRKVLPREDLLGEVWGPEWREDGHLLEVHISKLRRKLGHPDLIQTVRGVGYKMGGAAVPR